MFDHISIGVTDLARSAAFYDAALAPLGHVRLVENAISVCYGPKGYTGYEPPFAILTAPQVIPKPARFHIAFAATSREEVQRFHAAAVAAGGVDEGAPGLRFDTQTYYAAFVFDPDGHRLECVFHDLAAVRRE